MFIADLHIHSKYSRATSAASMPAQMDRFARAKGLQVVATGDLTHAAYRAELREQLVPAAEGLYRLKNELTEPLPGALAAAPAPFYIVSGEISSIYKKHGRVRKIHNVILLPSLEAADALSARLEALGCNLHSDGRPIIGLDSHDLLELTLDVCADAIFFPAHVWTPHFGLFGTYSGFDCIEDCFEDLTPYIHALETGLSSDPAMNSRVSALDRFTLISNSDAHSPAKLAREANLFAGEPSFPAIARSLANPQERGLLGTIEFFPEEGKYHWDGHRNCHVCLSPTETAAVNGICPVCGGKITVGVANRIEQLADRGEDYPTGEARHFEKLIPLPEVIAACNGIASAASVKVQRQHDALLQALGPELAILRELPIAEIERAAGPLIAEGVRRLRVGEVSWRPGFDGEYGICTILSPEDIDALSGQASLFGDLGFAPPPQKKKPGKPAATPASKTEAAAEIEPALHPYGLNEEQWQAASTTSAAVAVIAGPGTGKTKTLVSRIAHLIERGIDPATITAVTFTNKAAAEMKTRLNALLGDKKRAKAVCIGTFHSICLQLLKKEQRDIIILDAEDAQFLAEEVVSELSLKQTPRDLLAVISRKKSGQEESVSDLSAFDRYNEKLRADGALDFDDILLSALNLSDTAFQPSYLLVDEFQDINSIQYRLMQKWLAAGCHLFVIGDPDQAIYGFRGANAACFAQLSADMPQLSTIRLRKNYRSTPEILQAALPVLATAAVDRSLLAMRSPGRLVQLRQADAGFQEALYIVKEISRLVGGVDMLQAHTSKQRHTVYSFSEIAVLYRTHRQADQIEACLLQEGIPYTVTGRDAFLAAPAVRDCLAFFRSLLSPADHVARRRAEQALGEAYAPLAEQLRPRLRRGNPVAWIDQYVAACFLDSSEPMQKLRATALLQPDLPTLLQTLALGKEPDIERAGCGRYQPDAVRLLTLHAAKGMEFPVVFLAGVKDGFLPLKMSGRSADEAEERRLLYVGMTRAANELYLMQAEPLCPFTAAIPEEVLEKETFAARKPRKKQLQLFD